MKDYREELLGTVEEARRLSEILSPIKSLVDGVLAGLRQQEVERVGRLFDEIEDSPCNSCGSCCARGNQNGYFSRTPSDVHEDFLSGKVDITSFVVPSRDPSIKCSFLSPSGCNLPQKYRSTTCLKYTCESLREVLGFEHGCNDDLTFGYGSPPEARTLLQVRSIRQNLRKQS